MAFRQGRYGEGTGSSMSLAFSNSVQSGSLLVCVLRIGETSSGGTVTSGGRTFSLDQASKPSADWNFAIHSLPNAAGGATTVTVNLGASTDQFRMSILEFDSGPVSPPTDTDGSVGNSGTPNAGPVTMPSGGGLLICASASDSDEYKSSNPTPSNSFILITNTQLGTSGTGVPDKTEIAYRYVTTGGDYSCTMNGVNPAPWSAVLVAFATESGSPPTGTITLSVR